MQVVFPRSLTARYVWHQGGGRRQHPQGIPALGIAARNGSHPARLPPTGLGPAADRGETTLSREYDPACGDPAAGPSECGEPPADGREDAPQ